MRRLLFPTALLLLALTPFSQPPSSFHLTSITGVPFTTDLTSTGGVAWIDYDGDGHLDLFAPSGYDVSKEPVAQPNFLYRQDGTGGWETVSGPLTDAGFSSGSAWGDFDNDGDLDVFIPNQRGQDNALFRNDGGTFTPQAGVADGGSSYMATWGDANRDGWLDLFVSNGGLSGTGVNFFYLNAGDGTFQRTPIAATQDTTQTTGVTWVDVDRDGDSDLFVDGPQPMLYRNDGGTHFTPQPDAAFTREKPLLFGTFGSAWGDYDNDGDLDVYLAYGYGEQARLYQNDGRGQFTRVTDALPAREGHNATQSAWADLDQNGWLDLLLVPWSAPLVVYLNEGGQFTRYAPADLTTPSFGAALATGDYDRDGDLDVAIANWPNHPGPGERNQLFRNDHPPGQWLQLALVGTASNRAAIGARVEAEIVLAGQRVTLTREVRSAEGWRSQHSPTVHFGLGTATSVQVLRIFWPSGRELRLTNVAANQRTVLHEPPP